MNLLEYPAERTVNAARLMGRKNLGVGTNRRIRLAALPSLPFSAAGVAVTAVVIASSLERLASLDDSSLPTASVFAVVVTATTVTAAVAADSVVAPARRRFVSSSRTMTQLPWKLSQDRAGIRRRSEPGPVMSASLKAATSPVRPEQLVCPCTSQIPGNTLPGQ